MSNGDAYPQIEPEYGDGNVSLVCVGRDLGSEEVREGRPFANLNKWQGAGYVLNLSLKGAGIRRRDLLAISNVVNRRPPGNNFEAHSWAAIERGIDNLTDLLYDLDPNCVLAMGNVASYALVDANWPTKKRDPNSGTIKAAKGIQTRRGFIWEGIHGGKVVTTVHPSAIQRGRWKPFKTLFTEDLEKAKREAALPEFDYPRRSVHVPESRAEAEEMADGLADYDRLAADIETPRPDNPLACVGFAGETNEAVVFPGRYLDTFKHLLTDDAPKLIWANGQYDAYYLYTRKGIRVTVDDDTQLGWHALYPALAGGNNQKSYQMTRKSLAFLSTLYSRQPFWKDYDFDGLHEMYELNAIDVCVTLEVMEQLEDDIDEAGCRGIYEHNLSLVWPTVEIQARGMKIDEDLRQSRIAKLTERYKRMEDEINEMVVPLLKERKDRIEDKWHLFEVGGFEVDGNRRQTCPCCNGGSKKSQSCTDCAGIEGSGSSGAIVKDDLLKWAEENTDVDTDKLTKAELRELVPPCERCNGDGKRIEVKMNPTSDDQQKAVLYDLLRCQEKRYDNGKLTLDESSLRSIVAEI